MEFNRLTCALLFTGEPCLLLDMQPADVQFGRSKSTSPPEDGAVAPLESV